MIAAVILAAIPDSDTIIMSIIGRGTIFDHRGIMHSLLIACITGSLAAFLFRSKKWILPNDFPKLVMFFILAAASHPLLDGFSTGMHIGIAYLGPFDMTRYIFWISPLPLAPLSPAQLFSQRGINLFFSEVTMLWTFGFGAMMWNKRSSEKYWKVIAVILWCIGVVAWVMAI